jgi:hypothetical protein
MFKYENGYIYYNNIQSSIKIDYLETYSCGIITITGITRFYLDYEKNIIEELLLFIREKMADGTLIGSHWFYTYAQFSINDSIKGLSELLDKYCKYKTDFHLNQNSGNNIAIYIMLRDYEN